MHFQIWIATLIWRNWQNYIKKYVIQRMWQQIVNRKSASQNNICNRNKITAKKIRNLNKYI